MRVVREFAINYAQRLGNLVIHGSAFVAGNKGFIITGPKGAGKTTLLIHILNQDEFNFVANDRVVVSFNNDMAVLHGLPTIVKIPKTTINMFKDLQRSLLISNYDYHLTLKEIKSGLYKSNQPDSSGNFSISPKQLCHLLKVKNSDKANLSVLVFPQLTGKSGKIKIKELSPKKGAEKLMESLFRKGSKKLASSAFNLEPNTKTLDKKKLKTRCLDLTSRVRCIECFIGLDSLKNDYTFTKFVERLLN